jgi:coenzyme PQQ synthesis protein D (PqqD)
MDGLDGRTQAAMPLTGRLAIRTPNVTHKTIDGEVVVIDLDTGNYYSLAGVAADLWALAETHDSVEAVVATCLGRYSGRAGEIEASVRGFIERLVQESLLVPIAGEPPDTTAERLVTSAAPQPIPFEEPLLDKFTDMQDLLLLDPIHQVDEAGWPHAPKAP